MIDYDKLDAILRERKLSRRALAIQAGIAPGKMSTWYVRRTSYIPTASIITIADILNVPPWRLIRDDILAITDKEGSNDQGIDRNQT